MVHSLSFSDLKRLQNEQLDFLEEKAALHGGVAHYRFMGLHFFFINEPAVIRELLVKHPQHTHRDPITTDVFSRVTGQGLFVSEGASWRRQRKLIQPAFHALRIQQYADIMADYTAAMTANWRSGEMIAFDDAFTQLTLRIIARTMYGVDLEAQTQRLGRIMGELSEIAEAQLKMTLIPPAWLPTRQNRQQKRLRGEIEAVLKEIIAERRKRPEANDDLLSMLLLARDEDGEPMAETELLHECMTLFFAGHETTAALLTWATYLLTENPEVYDRLQAEIDHHLAGRPITFGDIAELPFLDAVLKETLRLYPPAYGFGRTAIEPFSIGEIDIPKRSTIFVNTYITQRRADLFPEPERFRPERFLDPDQQPDRYQYLPFGAGPRICVGNMFAMMEAAIILATLMQSTTFVRADRTPVVVDTRVTLRPRDPLLMTVQKRDDV